MVYKSTTAKSLLLLFILLFSVSLFNYVRAFDFEVGGDDGWAVPPAKDPDMYNDWASKNRFQVDDTIRKSTYITSLILIHGVLHQGF